MIIPALLAYSKKDLTDSLSAVKTLTDYIQIDMIDDWPGSKNTLSTFQLDEVPELGDFWLEFHIMSRKPELALEQVGNFKFLKKVKRIFVQIEYLKNPENFFALCKEKNIKSGIALDLPSFLGVVEKKLFYQLDAFLLMSVEAGKQGRKFSKAVLGKLKRAVRIKKQIGGEFEIAIDGGINDITAKWCYASGANSLFVGSYLLESEDINKNWQSLQK